jgi:hypothetical protein
MKCHLAATSHARRMMAQDPHVEAVRPVNKTGSEVTSANCQRCLLQVTWQGGKDAYLWCNLTTRNRDEYEGTCTEATQYRNRASVEKDDVCLPDMSGNLRVGPQCTRQVCCTAQALVKCAPAITMQQGRDKTSPHDWPLALFAWRIL